MLETVRRYERKFFLEGIDLARARALVMLHPALFSEPYPPRIVNNIYFDTPWMEHYDDNVSGSATRAKARLRWYHDLVREVDDGILEFKHKHGWVGWKESYPVPTFLFGPSFSARDLEALIRGSDLPAPVVERLCGYQFSLVNSYRREYYATRDNHFRVTLDSGITYFRAARLSNPLFASAVDHNAIVLELKYDAEYELQAKRVTSRFPFRMTRSSKYVRGIEHFL